MTTKVLDTIIKLRRDTQANYEEVGSTFIPLDGEPVLVDTLTDGLRIKIGDGFSTYNQLEYKDDLFVKGYYKDGKFYKNPTFTSEIQGAINRLYFDYVQNKTYFYDTDLTYKLLNKVSEEAVQRAETAANQAQNSATIAGNYASQAIMAAAVVENKIWFGTMAEYNALEKVYPTSIYVILDK